MAHSFFKHFNYSLGDEDSTVELQMLKPQVGHVVAVAGSGGRVVPLLARHPERLTCADFSEVQLALAEMRVAALRTLAREEYMGMLGYEPMSVAARLWLLRALPLSAASRDLLMPLFCAVEAGKRIVYEGRFERMLATLARVNGSFTRHGGRRIFHSDDSAGQKAYLDSAFPTHAWYLVLLLLGNSTVLNSLLYRGSFPKKNLPGSTYAIYKAIFDRLFRTILARRSFFLQMVFFGEVRFAEGFPVECDPRVYGDAQVGARNCRIEFVRHDIIEYVQACDRVDFLSLSDVPSFLPAPRDHAYLSALRPGLADGATVVTRGHLRVVGPNLDGYANVTSDFQDVIARETTQLWRVDVYQKHG